MRKTETALAPWVALGRFERAVDNVRDERPVVVVVLQRAAGAIPDGVRRSVIARLARRGAAVLAADDADEAAMWIARLARQEQCGPGGHAGSLGRKPRTPTASPRTSQLELVGLRLEYCHTRLAEGDDADWIAAHLDRACRPLGTSVTRSAEQRFTVEPPRQAQASLGASASA